MWIYQNSLLFVAMITQSIERKMYTFLIVGGDKSGIFDVGWLIGQYQKSTHLLPTDKPFCNWRLGVTDVSGGKRQSFPFKISVQIDWYAHFLWQSRPSPNPPPPSSLQVYIRGQELLYTAVFIARSHNSLIFLLQGLRSIFPYWFVIFMPSQRIWN